MPTPKQERSERVTWPLFWCLKPEDQARLMQFQWDKFGLRLEIPPLPSDIHIDTALESPEEIGRIIRKRPHHPKGYKL